MSFVSVFFFLFFNGTATTEIYTTEDTLSLHDALPICFWALLGFRRFSTRTSRPERRSEEHTSELQSPSVISYAVFCLKKKKKMFIFSESVFRFDSRSARCTGMDE